MESKFRISIVRNDGEAVYLYPGSQGERDLGDAVAKLVILHSEALQAAVKANIISQGVGLFRTEARVLAAITKAFAAVEQPLASLVSTSLATLLYEIKAEVVPG